jgi:ubiquinone/menaquinone biosynthesis C-methylase UbiE
MERRDEKSIKIHWESQATEGIEPQQVTLKDINQRHLEIDLICKYLDKRDLLLEIGCGNGYPTKFFANEVNFIHGIDYSTKMIERAIRESKNIHNMTKHSNQ